MCKIAYYLLIIGVKVQNRAKTLNRIPRFEQKYNNSFIIARNELINHTFDINLIPVYLVNQKLMMWMQRLERLLSVILIILFIHFNNKMVSQRFIPQTLVQ